MKRGRLWLSAPFCNGPPTVNPFFRALIGSPGFMLLYVVGAWAANIMGSGEDRPVRSLRRGRSMRNADMGGIDLAWSIVPGEGTLARVKGWCR
jgi:hypothetical protein